MDRVGERVELAVKDSGIGSVFRIELPMGESSANRSANAS